jgi:hypothetical protein
MPLSRLAFKIKATASKMLRKRGESVFVVKYHVIIIPKVITADQCSQLISDIEILMKRLGYAIYKGTVYKKNPRTTYSYTYKCEINAFVGTLEGKESFKS